MCVQSRRNNLNNGNHFTWIPDLFIPGYSATDNTLIDIQTEVLKQTNPNLYYPNWIMLWPPGVALVTGRGSLIDSPKEMWDPPPGSLLFPLMGLLSGIGLLAPVRTACDWLPAKLFLFISETLLGFRDSSMSSPNTFELYSDSFFAWDISFVLSILESSEKVAFPLNSCSLHSLNWRQQIQYLVVWLVPYSVISM